MLVSAFTINLIMLLIGIKRLVEKDPYLLSKSQGDALISDLSKLKFENKDVLFNTIFLFLIESALVCVCVCVNFYFELMTDFYDLLFKILRTWLTIFSSRNYSTILSSD